MISLSYDLHLHSCLSPCGDDDMTPANIVGMAALLGLDAIAVTDHNSVRNLPAVLRLADAYGILAVPGMEACTAEEIHMLCLFETLEGAMAFGAAVDSFLPDIPNQPEFFGHQYVMDEADRIVAEEPKLLINALSLSIDRLLPLAARYGGCAIPAHADKSSFSIVSSLGFLPPDYGFAAIELNPPNPAFPFDGRRITDSDAHDLGHIHEPVHHIEVKEKNAKGIVDFLRGR